MRYTLIWKKKIIIRWIEWVLVIVIILLRVAFITLYERKILGLTQTRLGPNKTIFKGLLQPLLDALKLLTKPITILIHYFKRFYIIRAFLAFLVSLMFWVCLPINAFKESEYLVIWLLLLFGLGTYRFLLAGWRSNSKYSLIGGWRRLSQAVSYEVILALLVLLPFLLNASVSIHPMFNFTLWGLIWVWILVMLAERQRAPFDLTEGERELVSGFNTEYGGVLFTFLFLGEYGRIMALRNISSYIWSGWNSRVFIWFTVWMWIRTCFPRVRYDKIMSLFWKIVLPFLIILWLLILGLSWWF